MNTVDINRNCGRGLSVTFPLNSDTKEVSYFYSPIFPSITIDSSVPRLMDVFLPFRSKDCEVLWYMNCDTLRVVEGRFDYVRSHVN